EQPVLIERPTEIVVGLPERERPRRSKERSSPVDGECVLNESTGAFSWLNLADCARNVFLVQQRPIIELIDVVAHFGTDLASDENYVLVGLLLSLFDRLLYVAFGVALPL